MPKAAHVAMALVVVLAMAHGAHADDVDDVGRRPHCDALPPNVDVPAMYRADVDGLIARSPTLRRQCAAIAVAAVTVHLVVRAAASFADDCRARGTFRRLRSGRLEARIDLPFSRDFPELLAHELEHVVEQIEGVRLSDLADRGVEGVRRAHDGAFETRRARDAGRRAALEIETSERTARQRVRLVGEPWTRLSSH
jgi:hypothetical protein